MNGKVIPRQPAKRGRPLKYLGENKSLMEIYKSYHPKAIKEGANSNKNTSINTGSEGMEKEKARQYI